MSTLLIGGVLGGLLAPLSSQAGTPTLTLQIDNLTPLQKTTNGTAFTDVANNNSILGAKLSACSAADQGLGYTDCYAILTSTTTAYRANNGRLYRIQNATGATARLRVGDNLGQDNFTLVGVQFVPVVLVGSAFQPVTAVNNWGSPDANTNEQHVLKITMRNKFDAPINQNNATGVVVGGTTIGQVAFGMASGGEFRSAPLSTPVPTTTLFCTTGTAAARCNTVGDNVTLTGTGNFNGTATAPFVAILSPTAPNSSPLSLTVGAGNANNSIVGYAGLTNATMGQVNPTYPKFDCVDKVTPNSLTKCQPDIILTMTATLKGPDTFVLLNGKNAFCAICNYAQDNNRLTRLFTFLSNVIAVLNWWENTHADNPRLRAFIDAGQAFLAGFSGPPADPDCAGAKYVQSQLLFESGKNLLTIAGDGGAEVDPAPAVSSITLFNTGLAEDGSVDPHYSLIESADESFPGPYAIVANPPAGAWVSNTLTSKWISPSANQTQNPGGGNPVGNYTYRTTFDLTGLDPDSASITGQWATDNSGFILINGSSTGQTIPFGFAAFQSFTPFSISTGFMPGINTLDFVTNNACCADGNPTGLRVELSGTANSVPPVP